MGLFCIFRCLHLSNRRTRNADFNLRFAGDFQNDGIAIDTVDRAVNAAAGDDLVSGLEIREHRLHLLALALLGHDHQEIHDDEHEAQRNQKSAKAATRSLKNRCRHHHLASSYLSFSMPKSFNLLLDLPDASNPEKLGTTERRRAACSPTSTHALLLVPRGRPAQRFEPALRPDLQHSARASQMRNSLGSQTR